MKITIKPFEVATIYKIQGGFQRARQNCEYGLPVMIETIEDSDWPVLSNCHGQQAFTGAAWNVNLEKLKEQCRAWCEGHGKVKFVVK